MILVHGTIKFLEMVERAELSVDHARYQPLHFEKGFKRVERKLQKILARVGWYDGDGMKTNQCSWRHLVPDEWRGSKPCQRKVPGIAFSTVIQVPNLCDGVLLKALCKAEPRLTRLSGKVVEKGGRPLSLCFSKSLSTGKCQRDQCFVCLNPAIKGP